MCPMQTTVRFDRMDSKKPSPNFWSQASRTFGFEVVVCALVVVGTWASWTSTLAFAAYSTGAT